jgi:membrane-bound serine protease (ClpP class)
MEAGFRRLLIAGFFMGLGLGPGVLGTGIFFGGTVRAAQATDADRPGVSGRVLKIEIRGSINPASLDYLQQAIRKATSDRSALLLVGLDTPGGLVSSVRSMAQAVQDSEVPVVVFVHPAGAGATSAGALLMLASHVGAMAPGATMGAAHPVGPGGAEIPGSSGQKATQDVASFARGLAEVRGRNRVAAEAIVERSQSYTAQEALREGLIEIVAEDVEQLLRSLQGYRLSIRGREGAQREVILPGNLVALPRETLPMTLGQKVLSTLAHPDIATLLMSVGGLLLYVELQTPGVGIAGGLGVVCLLAALTSYQLIPIRTTGLILLLLGLALFLAEVFVSAHGSLAVAGMLAFALGAIWLMDPSWSTQPVSPVVWISAVVFMGGVALLVAVAASRMARQVARARAEIAGGAQSGLAGYVGQVIEVRPEGSGSQGEIFIRGERWRFESSESLHAGDWVEVVSMKGFLAQVHPASSPEGNLQVPEAAVSPKAVAGAASGARGGSAS